MERVSLITVTEAAQEKIASMCIENNMGAVRPFVMGGGCSGMQYGLVFDEQREGDHELDYDGVSVVVDSFSAKYLQGSVVDFSDALNDGGFKVTIPGAKTTCGCGKSFEA